jgi:hypothetical protein
MRRSVCLHAPAAMMASRNASYMSPPKQATSPVDIISTPRVGSAPAGHIGGGGRGVGTSPAMRGLVVWRLTLQAGEGELGRLYAHVVQVHQGEVAGPRRQAHHHLTASGARGGASEAHPATTHAHTTAAVARARMERTVPGLKARTTLQPPPPLHPLRRTRVASAMKLKSNVLEMKGKVREARRLHSITFTAGSRGRRSGWGRGGAGWVCVRWRVGDDERGGAKRDRRW